MLLKQFSFELRIMLKKRRRKLEEHKDGVRKRLTFVVPAQEAKGGQPLAPILGQVQINTMDFVDAFNKQSLIFEIGYPVFVELLVNWDTTHKFSFLKFPFIFFINLFTFYFQNNLYICISQLLKLVSIYKLLYSTRTYSDFFIFSQILSILACKQVNVSLFSQSILFLNIFKCLKNFNSLFKQLNALIQTQTLLNKDDVPIKKNKNKKYKIKKRRK